MLNREFLIQLTSNLYRLTLLFPKKEPLRYKMRELANDILAGCLKLNFILEQNENLFKKPEKSGSTRALKDLEVLDGFFDIVFVQKWVSPSEILAIKQEYGKLAGELKQLKAENKEGLENENETVFETEEAEEINPIKSRKAAKSVNERQEKIISFLKENGRAQVWQIKQIMPEVTKRTLRRDFEYMLEQGLIERMGEKNDTFYQI